jgi:hypothetical protein
VTLVARYWVVDEASAAPVASPAAASSYYSEDDQKQDGSDSSRSNRVHDAGANANAELRQQPGTDERTDDPDDDVANDPRARPLDELARKPACNEAN